MATSNEAIIKFAAMENDMPQDAQGIGCVQSKDGRFVMFGFKTKREIITEAGYLSSDADCDILYACMNVLCNILKGKAVISAGLHVSPDIEKALSDDGRLDKKDRAFAAMAEIAARCALSDYAKRRTEVTV